jgi:hypothetical protein
MTLKEHLDVTPHSLCGIGQCPGVFSIKENIPENRIENYKDYDDFTPSRLRCAFGQCIGIFKWTFNKKEYLDIIGKKDETGELDNLIPLGYKSIRIPVEYFDNIGGPISRFLRRWGL